MRQDWLVAFLCLGLCSCGYMNYYAASPLHPMEPSRWAYTDSYDPPVVDSLSPTLSWETICQTRGERYDLAIYKTQRVDDADWPVGKRIYFREGIPTREHKLDITLRPNQAYYWSIRVPCLAVTGVSPTWSRFVYYSNWSFIGSGCLIEDFPFFLFATPPQ